METTRTKIARAQHIVVHGGCPDGLAAAILAHDVLPKAQVSFVQHKTPEYENLKAEPGMLFIDIVPPPERIEEFIEQGTVVLDHHEKAQSIVAAFPHGEYSEDLSGAEMAYRHVFAPLKEIGHTGTAHVVKMMNAEHFATLAGIRDTWRRDDDRWKAACEQAAVLAFFPSQNWLDIQDPFGHEKRDLWKERRAIGAMLFQQRQESTKRSVERAWRVTTNGGNRVIVIGGQNVSDAAELIGNEADIIVNFTYKFDGSKCMFVAGLRSHTGVDVGDLAVHHGGGGHRSAAGFSYAFDPDVHAPPVLAAVVNPFTLIQMLIEQWEAR